MKKKITIGVISRISSKTVDAELAKEARRRGHGFKTIAFDTVEITNSTRAFEREKLLSYDIMYYRTSLGTVWARALERYLRKHGRCAVNLMAVQYPFLNNKSLQTLTVASEGIRTPKTILNGSQCYSTIVAELGTTFVVKGNNSAQGKEVHLIQSEGEYEAFLRMQVHQNYLYQEYIQHTYDCRIHLIEGKPVAGYRRVQYLDDFRCNVSLGADMEPLDEVDVSVLFPLAEKIANIFGLELHAVDFLRSDTDGEYYFVEINENPGWEYSDKQATGVDLSALIIDSFEREVTTRSHVVAHAHN